MERKPTGGEVSFTDMYESMDHVRESAVNDFIKKFEMKMKGSSLETAKGWVDGIGELSKPEKEKLLKSIVNKGMVKESELSEATRDLDEARGAGLSKGDRAMFTWSEINTALMTRGYAAAKIADILSTLMTAKRDAQSSKHALKNKVKSAGSGMKWQKSDRWESADDMTKLGLLIEDSTENAKKSLQAIIGMFKGKEDNDIAKMGRGIMDYYKKKGSFAPDQAKWIWKTSVALFKK
jgi:hypothetical protein